jgi:hypothetical protein
MEALNQLPDECISRKASEFWREGHYHQEIKIQRRQYLRALLRGRQQGTRLIAEHLHRMGSERDDHRHVVVLMSRVDCIVDQTPMTAMNAVKGADGHTRAPINGNAFPPFDNSHLSDPSLEMFEN